jgi:hypothetical protein
MNASRCGDWVDTPDGTNRLQQIRAVIKTKYETLLLRGAEQYIGGFQCRAIQAAVS